MRKFIHAEIHNQPFIFYANFEVSAELKERLRAVVVDTCCGSSSGEPHRAWDGKSMSALLDAQVHGPQMKPGSDPTWPLAPAAGPAPWARRSAPRGEPRSPPFLSTAMLKRKRQLCVEALRHASSAAEVVPPLLTLLPQAECLRLFDECAQASLLSDTKTATTTTLSDAKVKAS